jgi:hypothetical protein
MSVKDLINAIASGSAIQTEQAFNQVMAEKISARLDDMRVEVAQNMFSEGYKKKMKEEESCDSEDEDEDKKEDMKEEVEELDEISKGTMGRYLAKAGADIANREGKKNELRKKSDEIWQNTSSLGNRDLPRDVADKLSDVGHQARKSLEKQVDTHSEKQWKRQKGIQTAIKKISK